MRTFLFVDSSQEGGAIDRMSTFAMPGDHFTPVSER